MVPTTVNTGAIKGRINATRYSETSLSPRDRANAFNASAPAPPLLLAPRTVKIIRKKEGELSLRRRKPFLPSDSVADKVSGGYYSYASLEMKQCLKANLMCDNVVEFPGPEKNV